MTDIVSEICDKAIERIPIACPDFEDQLDYVYDLQMNSADSMEKRFGFIPLGARPVPGTNGAKTYDHTFQVILTEEVSNDGCDKDMRDKIKSLYPCLFAICEDFIKNKSLCISNATTTIIQVKEGEVDIPEILGENDGVALRMNLVFQYRIRT